MPMRFVYFSTAGLSIASSDRVIWRFAQARQMILLTGNRNKAGDNSLEQTIQEESQPSSLPVITIGNIDRVLETAYRQQCATRLAEIVFYLDNYRGTRRLYIP